MTRSYTRNYHCLDCGAPVGRQNARCPGCRKIAKAAWRKGYMLRYHDQHRPAPTPQPQADPTLPSHGQLVTDDAGERVQCHVCGNWYRSLVTHVRMHGFDADRYKAEYGLARNTPLTAPATSAKLRQNAYDRDQGSIGRQALIDLDLIGKTHNPGGYDIPLGGRIAISGGHRLTASDD